MPRSEPLEQENKISLTDIEGKKTTAGASLEDGNSKKSRHETSGCWGWRYGAQSYTKITRDNWISWFLISLCGSGNNMNDDSSALVVHNKTRVPKWSNSLPFPLLACFMLNMYNCVLCLFSLSKRPQCYLSMKRRKWNCFYNAATVLWIWDHSNSACVMETWDSSLLFPRRLPSTEPNWGWKGHIFSNTCYIQLCCKHEADIVYNARRSRFPSSSAKTRDFPLDFLDKRLPPALSEEARARTQSILYYRVDNFLQNQSE